MSGFSFDSVIFDLDGVITRTAEVHAAAWKKAFDEYLKMRSERDGETFREFTHEGDYLPYVDGKPRYEGVASFLGSRGIEIPFGEESDGPDKETVCGIGNRKNEFFLEVLREDGPGIYEPAVALIKSLADAGIRVGVASSSKNCKVILEAAGLEKFFGTRVDGVVSRELGLKGKPEGDIFVRAARDLGSAPERSVVLEDATSGVMAGRNGGFGLVIGVARHDNGPALLENGADIAVETIGSITIDVMEKFFDKRPRFLFNEWDSISAPCSMGAGISVNPCYNRPAEEVFLGAREPVFFLDYDGTLTPIVERPELAVVSEEMQDMVVSLAARYTVAVVSGRMREDVENLLGVKGILYAGSHGLDIKGEGFSMIHPDVESMIPVVDRTIERLHAGLKTVKDVLIEEKKFSVAVHYRQVDKEDIPRIRKVVDDVVSGHDRLRILEGKKVFEILPDIDWDKGRAIRWIMKALGKEWEDHSVIYIGDDTTDEYAFRAIRTRGSGILVSAEESASSADFQIASTEEVKKLFGQILKSS